MCQSVSDLHQPHTNELNPGSTILSEGQATEYWARSGMNPIIDRIYCTGVVEDAAGDAIPAFPSSIRRSEGEHLYRLVRDRGLERTLEIGMGYGLSTLFVCQGHKERGRGFHVAIDPNQSTTFRSIGVLNAARADVDFFVQLYEEESYKRLPILLSEDESFDFVLVDGMHLFDYALVDFFYTDLLLRVGGFIAIHDMWMPALRRVVSFILRNRAYRLVRIDTTVGMSRAVRAGKTIQKLLQAPLSRDYSRFRFGAESLCVLEKTADDERKWDFHRRF